MSNVERNTALVRAIFERWHETKGNSAEFTLSHLADKIRFGSLANGSDPATFTRTRVTRDDVRSYLTELTTGWTMHYYRMDDYVAQGDRVVAIGSCSWSNKATGKRVTTPKVDVFGFDDDGKIIEFFEYYDTAALFAAATPG